MIFITDFGIFKETLHFNIDLGVKVSLDPPMNNEFVPKFLNSTPFRLRIHKEFQPKKKVSFKPPWNWRCSIRRIHTEIFIPLYLHLPWKNWYASGGDLARYSSLYICNEWILFLQIRIFRKESDLYIYISYVCNLITEEETL